MGKITRGEIYARHRVPATLKCKVFNVLCGGDNYANDNTNLPELQSQPKGPDAGVRVLVTWQQRTI